MYERYNDCSRALAQRAPMIRMMSSSRSV
jgi:hypothetical protein